MKIGELVQRTGLAPSRIRFYERIGLLKTVERQANGYRSYSDDAVLALGLIATGQRAGFSLEELRALLPGDLAQWEHGTLLDERQPPAQGKGMTRRILHVVSNVAHYRDPTQPTGLWLSELTHAWHVFAARGYEQRIVSPQGGLSPLEPRSLEWPLADASVKEWLADPSRMALLSSTARPGDIDPADFDAIYFTGGHAVLWDFPDSEGLQRITRAIHERGGIVSSVCHGYCGLLNTRLSDGSLLVAGRRLTGFSWREEVLAGVAAKMPYDAEKEMKRRGARYEKAWLPFVSKVVVDGRLVTGQNPMSARATAERVAALL